jgi:dihydrofolate synthase/folylpolyglutamate synthase
MQTTTDNWDYRGALRAIWERSAYDRGFISNPFAGDDAADLGLRRTSAILDHFDRPQDRYGIVHVAGSKGKGSTTAFIDAILTAAGYRVGRYTQPHLHSMRERIAVNGQSIDAPAFADLIRRGIDAAESIERERPDLGEITAFELTTALSLVHFADAGCDLAVVEVGLGGALDATNVVTPLVSVITALDLEHTAVLGDTIDKIAAQKAGVIKPSRPVVVSPQPAEALAVIERVAAERNSPLFVGGRDWQWSGTWRSFSVSGPWGTIENLTSSLAGRHQIENACTAVAATLLLSSDDVKRSFADAQDDRKSTSSPCHPERSEGSLPFTVAEDHIRTGLAHATWPGRYEVVAEHGPRVIVDGAHSPASARALVDALREDCSAPAVVVLGLLGDKDANIIGEALAPVADRFVVTAPRSPRAAPAASVAARLAATGVRTQTESDVASAIDVAMAQAGAAGTVVVTGSLSTVAEAREKFGLGVHDPPVGD